MLVDRHRGQAAVAQQKSERLRVAAGSRGLLRGTYRAVAKTLTPVGGTSQRLKYQKQSRRRRRQVDALGAAALKTLNKTRLEDARLPEHDA